MVEPPGKIPKMKTELKLKRPSGSKKMNEPRVIGDIINEMFQSDSLLAKGYRKFLASKENSAEKGGEL